MPQAHRIGIIMHDVDGRRGINRPLLRSIPPSDMRRLMPDPIIGGRSRDRIGAPANRPGIERPRLRRLRKVLPEHRVPEAGVTLRRDRFLRHVLGDAARHDTLAKGGRGRARRPIDLQNLEI
jgi:hypothetical protein